MRPRRSSSLSLRRPSSVLVSTTKPDRRARSRRAVPAASQPGCTSRTDFRRHPSPRSDHGHRNRRRMGAVTRTIGMAESRPRRRPQGAERYASCPAEPATRVIAGAATAGRVRRSRSRSRALARCRPRTIRNSPPPNRIGGSGLRRPRRGRVRPGGGCRRGGGARPRRDRRGSAGRRRTSRTGDRAPAGTRPSPNAGATPPTFRPAAG